MNISIQITMKEFQRYEVIQKLIDKKLSEKETSNEDANKFLKEYIPKFNQKFAVVPAQKADLHQSLNFLF